MPDGGNNARLAGTHGQPEIAAYLGALVKGKPSTTSQADSPMLWRTCGPDVDQPSMRTTIQAGSEAVGQLPPEP
jgi:hypothetical protein